MKIQDVFPEVIAIRQWKVRSRTDSKKLYLVEQMADKSFICSCISGQMRRKCWHVERVRTHLRTGVFGPAQN